jgi:hypothetical protein
LENDEEKNSNIQGRVCVWGSHPSQILSSTGSFDTKSNQIQTSKIRIIDSKIQELH